MGADRPLGPRVRAAALACLLAALASAQAAVRLVKVPDVVRLPAPAGGNLLVEVEVDGAPTDVWLATDLASRDRVALAAAGGSRWQVNLADPRVAALLPAGRDGGALYVHAAIGGTTKASVPILWARATGGDGKVRCLVRTSDGTTTTIENGTSAWLDPAKLERVDLHGAGARQSAVVARFGDLELPLVRHADAETWVLQGDAGLRARLRDASAFEIEARLGAGSALFHFAVVPGRLQLPDGTADFVVPQRRRATVPGSNGWFTVHIGDITMGGTMLRVTTADGGTAAAQQLLHERDFVELALADERYVLVVDKLANLLVGDDHAELRVLRAAGFQPDRIGQLIRAVGQSADTFVREGQDHPGSAAMQLLVAKVGSHRGPALTVDAFIDTLASRSSTTGQAYQVRRRDGSTVTMQQWLREALREFEAKDAAAGKRAK